MFKEEQGMADSVAVEQAKFFKNWHKINEENSKINVAEAEEARRARLGNAGGTEFELLTRYGERGDYNPDQVYRAFTIAEYSKFGTPRSQSDLDKIQDYSKYAYERAGLEQDEETNVRARTYMESVNDAREYLFEHV